MPDSHEGAVTMARPGDKGERRDLRAEESCATAACQGQPGRVWGGSYPDLDPFLLAHVLLNQREAREQGNPERSASQARAEMECYQIGQLDLCWGASQAKTLISAREILFWSDLHNQ